MNLKCINFFLRVIFLGCILFCASAFSQDLNTILNYYNQGDFKSAQEGLESYLVSNPSDFEALYLAGKLERNSQKSIRYYKKVWESSSEVKKEDAGIELCLYYRSMGLNDSLIQLCSKFKEIFPQSQLLPQILWLESQAYFSSGRAEKALKGFENVIGLYSYSPWAAWAQLGVAEVYFSQGDFEKSLKEYKKTVDQYAETDAFPLALSGIYRTFENTGEKDKAILYLNLYKEKFPQGIHTESEVIFEEITKEKDLGKAEELTGTKYAIQIGVFGEKENADRIIEKLKSKGYNPERSYKTIKSKRYYVIRVGSFDSLSEAQELREKLEREEGEVFRIVIR